MKHRNIIFLFFAFFIYTGYKYISISDSLSLEKSARPDVLIVENCKIYTKSKKIKFTIFEGFIKESSTKSAASYSKEKSFRNDNNFPELYIDVNKICKSSNSEVEIWVYDDSSATLRGKEARPYRIQVYQRKADFWQIATISASLLLVSSVIYTSWKTE